jgi:hypothetical protein
MRQLDLPALWEKTKTTAHKISVYLVADDGENASAGGSQPMKSNKRRCRKRSKTGDLTMR